MNEGFVFFRALSKEGAEINFVKKFGLAYHHFQAEEQEVFHFVNKYVAKYKQVPSLKRLLKRFSSVEFPKPKKDETLLFCAERLKARYAREISKRAVNHLVKLLNEGRDDELTDAMLNLSRTLERGKVDDICTSSREIGDIVLRQHDQQQAAGDTAGRVPFGFFTLDYQTSGMAKGELITLVGNSGVGKTFTMVRMALEAHRQGHKVMFVSMEMEESAIMRRLLALDSGISETQLRKGRLSSLTGRKKIAASLKKHKEGADFHIINGGLALYLSDLESQIAVLEPDVVYVDGAYILRVTHSSNRYADVAESTEELKRIAMRQCVPIVGSYQFNKQKGIYGGDIIRFTASLQLDLKEDTNASDLIDPIHGVSVRKIFISKGRYGENGQFLIRYDMLHTSIEEVDEEGQFCGSYYDSIR